MTFRTMLPFFAFLAITGCLGKTASPEEERVASTDLSQEREAKPAETPSDKGEPDGSVGCPPVLPPVCPAGQRLADTNGDGCALECEEASCPPFAPTCPPGHVVADTNGDGCAAECMPAQCPPFYPTCKPGEKVADADGDGCAVECVPE